MARRTSQTTDPLSSVTTDPGSGSESESDDDDPTSRPLVVDEGGAGGESAETAPPGHISIKDSESDEESDGSGAVSS